MIRPRLLTGIVLILALAAGPLTTPLAQSGGGRKPEEPKLLGKCTPEQLSREPYVEWYQKGFRYMSRPETIEALRALDVSDLSITVFFGTWCGDSRREVPRLVRILDMMEFPRERLTLVAVDNDDKALKRSPDGEEQGRGIYKVPTVLFSRNGEEFARFQEHPVLSLERDLLTILSGEPYAPGYDSYPTLQAWLDEGLLSDPNINARGLASRLDLPLESESELVAFATVLMSRGQSREAATVYEMNAALYPESVRTWAGLARALNATGAKREARQAAERALRFNDDPARIPDLADLIVEIGAVGSDADS